MRLIIHHFNFEILPGTLLTRVLAAVVEVKSLTLWCCYPNTLMLCRSSVVLSDIPSAPPSIISVTYWFPSYSIPFMLAWLLYMINCYLFP